jgi:hypothetical protein
MQDGCEEECKKLYHRVEIVYISRLRVPEYMDEAVMMKCLHFAD